MLDLSFCRRLDFLVTRTAVGVYILIVEWWGNVRTEPKFSVIRLYRIPPRRKLGHVDDRGNGHMDELSPLKE